MAITGCQNEEPLKPEMVVNTGVDTLEYCVQQVLEFLRFRGIISESG